MNMSLPTHYIVLLYIIDIFLFAYFRIFENSKIGKCLTQRILSMKYRY
jgi:hypothetical protein